MRISDLTEGNYLAPLAEGAGKGLRKALTHPRLIYRSLPGAIFE